MMKNHRISIASLVSPWMLWLGFLGLLLLSALATGILVFWKGLSITNLTDLVPWGFWITIDLSSIALSAGAFSLCAGVCVVLYLTVLFFEAMPIFATFEWLRHRWPKLAGKMEHIHHYAPILAIIGLGLSSLHQSSLGATYGVIKARPFWFKPEMSVLFMFSAIVGGIALTLFASMLASRLTAKAKVNDVLIERVSGFLAWLLVGYFYFRFWDTFATTYTYDPGRTEGLNLVTSGILSFNFWIGEMLLGIFVPMVLLLYGKTRSNRFWRMVALFLVAAGVVAYRWDTNLAGLLVVVSYLPGEAAISYTSYRPSLVEWVTGLGIVAYGLLAFSLGVKYLRVVDHSLVETEQETVKVKSAETVTA